MMKKLLSCAITLLSALSLAAQSNGHPGVQRTLSNENTTALVRDDGGYIWIGTQRGLNRFNGSTYKIWYQNDENSLSDDYVTALCPDTDGRLWVGTTSGIELVRNGETDPSARVILSRINALAVENEQYLLYSTAGGLGRLDKESLASTEVYTDRRMIYPRFILTSDRRIWISHVTRPILTILDDNFRVLQELELPGKYIKHYEDGTDGSVYVCTDRGLERYTTDGQRLELQEPVKSLTEGKDILFYTKGENRNTMLLGIRGEGIWIHEGGRLSRIWDQEALGDTDNCRVCVADRNIWLSKNSQGLTWGPLRNVEMTVRLPQTDQADALNMFYGRPDGSLLVITNRNVWLIDPTDNRCINMDPADHFGNDQLGITLLDSRGDLWILHNYRELHRYGIGAERLVHKERFRVLPTVSIWEDRQTGEVCLLQGDEVLRIRPDESFRTETMPPHPEFWFCGTLRSGQVYFLSKENIWLLDGQGFSRLECPVQAPGSLYEDTFGRYWIGSRSQGVFLHEPETGRTIPVTTGGAESDRSIRSITGDDNGNIWITTRFDATLIPAATGRIHHFRSGNLGTFAFNTNSAVTLADGTVWFGIIDRLIGFKADAPSDNPVLQPRIDEVLVNNTQVFRSIPDVLELEHDQTQLSIYFSAMNFNPVLQPVYQYKLEGFDRDWIYGGDHLRAGYSRLRSGKYTFRVRVMQTDGMWSPYELVQDIRIKASPWLSRPALFCYILIALVSIFLLIRQFIRFRINREKLNLAEEEKLLVEQMSQERTTFFTNVSHEFRTPLSLIYGPVKELGQSETLGEHERELVGLIERNSERMVRLTDQLLHFNRSSADMDSLSVMRNDLSVVLRKILENFSYMFSQKNLRVTTVIPQEMIAWCDREKVEKIIFNLLSNAVKYTPEHGEITVRAVTENGEAVISVADTGIGISPDKMSRIFERYERLGEQVGGGMPSGFGIGLHYARHLAHVHKGNLSVQANDPIGSVFTFAFPYAKEAYSEDAIWQEDAPQTDEGRTNLLPPPNAISKVNVLVVEDNPDMREYISGFLRDEHAVTVAADGEEAWRLIRISTPDLVVSDVMMPFKDGYTLCKEIKNDPEFCHIPVILLTAKADMDNQIHGLELGADAYIGKPFDPSYFTTVVRNLLANRRRMQQALGERTSATTEPIAEETPVSAQDKAFLDKLFRIIDENISDEDFNVTVLSMEMGMSRTSIFSKLKALVGQSPQTFLTNYRLNRAMELLKTRDYNISEVAYKVGFSTLTGFSRSFKNKFGVPPSSV